MGADVAAASPSRAIPPGTRLGRYVVVDRIGRGGMAEVHLGRAEGLSGFEKVVALKVIHSHLVDDPTYVKMLLKEARVAATLDHPSIVQVFDVGVEAGQYYLTMEYVHGVDARQLLRRLAGRDRMPLLFALLVVHEVAAALHYAHTRCDAKGEPLGIVHRDVSPSNVMIGFDGAVKLTDFGIAKVSAQTSHTATGTLKGKFGYMSPEQSMTQTVDPRSDVFALGVLLYELTTGHRAFAADSAFATMNAVIAGDYPPPETHVPDYPPDLAAIVQRALQVDPADRYPTAHTLRIDVDAVARRLGGPATRPELGTFVGDLFEWPSLPDTSFIPAPPARGGTEIALTPAAGELDDRPRRSPLLFGGLGAAVLAVVVAGYAGWQAGRSSSETHAAVPPPTAATPASPPSSEPTVSAAAPAPAATPDGDAAPDPDPDSASADDDTPQRGDKRRRRRPRKGKQGKRPSGGSGIEAILPPSAKEPKRK